MHSLPVLDLAAGPAEPRVPTRRLPSWLKRNLPQGNENFFTHRLLRERAAFRAEAIQILADVQVKHSAPLAPRPLELEVDDLIHRAGADGLIVSGPATGQPPDLKHVKAVKAHASDTPVLLGSGGTSDNVAALAPWVDGFIVGTAFKTDGRIESPVDRQRVERFMAALG